MTQLVPLTLFSWPLIVVGLFLVLHPRRAVIAAFLFAWLFLPVAGFRFEGIPNYDKMAATVYGAILGIAIFDAARLVQFRPSWIDLPILIWCLVPLASSLTNGLGAYDGTSAIFSQVVRWGLPYFIGRLYFSDLEGIRELAVGVFLGGLIYVPLCLWEVRMSPQLHNWIYGFRPSSFSMTIRFGGYRPMVFMQHGLALSLWMAATTLVGVWLWATGALKQLWNVPMWLWVGLMMVTAVLTRSAGALALLAMCMVVLFAVRQMRTSVLVLCVALMPAIYIGARASGLWDAFHLVRFAEVVVRDERRVGSLLYRLQQESTLGEHAWRQPLFGWGGWGRNRPAQMGYDESDVATDGLWIITFGQRGLVGLAALYAALLVPVVLLWKRLPAVGWWHPTTAPAAALAVVVVMFALDSLLNAMLNPIFVLATGGISGLVVRLALAQKTAQQRTARPTHVSGPLQPNAAAS